MSADLLYATVFVLIAFLVVVPSFLAMLLPRLRERQRRVHAAPPPGIYRVR